MNDLFNNVKAETALSPRTINSNTTTAGAIIDLAGFSSCLFLISSGTLTDGSYTPLIEYGDAANLSDAVAVPDEDLLGTEALVAFAATDDNLVKKVGLKVKKRYARLSIVSAGTSSGGVIGAQAIKGHPLLVPAV